MPTASTKCENRLAVEVREHYPKERREKGRFSFFSRMSGKYTGNREKKREKEIYSEGQRKR